MKKLSLLILLPLLGILTLVTVTTVFSVSSHLSTAKSEEVSEPTSSSSRLEEPKTDDTQTSATDQSSEEAAPEETEETSEPVAEEVAVAEASAPVQSDVAVAQAPVVQEVTYQQATTPAIQQQQVVYTHQSGGQVLSNGNTAGATGAYAAAQMAAATGVSQSTWEYIIARESNGQVNARNASGASGLFQTMPGWGSTATVQDQINAALNAYNAQGLSAWGY